MGSRERRSGSRAALVGRRGAPALRASVAHLRALAHPLRIRIFELFAERPRTTMQVAELLGQPPTRLYHHVNALERAGLIRLRERRPKRGTIEKWFEVVGPLVRLADLRSQNSGAARRPLQALAVAALDQARDELTAALARPDGRAIAVRLVAIGSRSRLAAIRRRLVALIRDLPGVAGGPTAGRAGAAGSSRPATSAAGAKGKAVERWALTLTFAPAWFPEAAARARSQRATR